MPILKPLNRRTFLQGAGSLISLPFLEAMMPLRANAQTAFPLRLGTFYFPFGVYQQAWAPSTAGTNFTIPNNLSALTPHRSRIILTKGLGNYDPDWSGSHMASPPCFTQGIDPVKGGGLRVGDISADVKLSNFMREKNAALRPLMLAPAAAAVQPGGLFNDYNGNYMVKLSWVNTTTSASLLTNPQAAFEMLFGASSGGGGGGSSTDPLVQYRLARGKSVLDSVLGQANAIKAKVGTSDREKLDQYFTSLREVERTIAAAAGSSGTQNPSPSCTPGQRPSNGLRFDAEVKVYMDLAVLAMVCDKSRVITHFMDPETNDPRIPVWAGVSGENHHLFSHYRDRGGDAAPYLKITAWYASQLAYLLERLKSYKEGDKDMLYNSVIVFGSGMGDGSDHDTYNLPIVIAGELGGQIRTGQAIHASRTPMSNMWLSILRKFGMQIDKHGDSTGALNLS